MAVNFDCPGAGEMGWIGRDGIADCCVVGIIVGGVDRDPVCAASHAPDTTSQGADADGVVGREVAVVRICEAKGKGAGGGVLGDGYGLAGHSD